MSGGISVCAAEILIMAFSIRTGIGVPRIVDHDVFYRIVWKFVIAYFILFERNPGCQTVIAFNPVFCSSMTRKQTAEQYSHDYDACCYLSVSFSQAVSPPFSTQKRMLKL